MGKTAQNRRKKLRAAADAACTKLKSTTLKAGVTAFPSSCSVNYKYPRLRNDNWEAGLYTGCFWLAYMLGGDEFFKETALAHIETYRERFDAGRYIDSHDAGFVYIPSCVAAYKLFGDKAAEGVAMDILDYYYNHCYSFDGKFIIRNNRKAREGLICRVTHAKPQGEGIDECAPYGDYFYLEALARYLLPDFTRFW